MMVFRLLLSSSLRLPSQLQADDVECYVVVVGSSLVVIIAPLRKIPAKELTDGYP